MTSVFKCPACSQTISTAAPVGALVECPLCHQAITVPALPEPEPLAYASNDRSRYRRPGGGGTAIGALVCGLVSAVGCPLVGLMAIVLGIVSLNKSRGRGARSASRAFATAAIVLGGGSFPVYFWLWYGYFDRSHDLSVRTVCSANLRGIGSAMYIYAEDAPYKFPVLFDTFARTSANMFLFNPQHRASAPSPTGIPSPTVDLWILPRTYMTTPKQFICPSTKDVPDPATDLTPYYDFACINNLSYAYHYQHDPRGRILGTSSDPGMALMADANPYIKGGVNPANFAADRASRSLGNSRNHYRREGQNVLFVDGHASFTKRPDVSHSVAARGGSLVPMDNIYTVYASSDNAPMDPGVAAPTWTSPTLPGTCVLGGKSDTCLVP